jgi:chromosomal replication initiator protein
VLRQFVVGPENQLANIAVQSVLKGPVPVGSPVQYNPLVFHGPPGVGKSHLALGLHAAWKRRFQGRLSLWVTGQRFARDFHEAVETKTVGEFRSPYRRLRMLVFEDLDYLAGRSAAQRELLLVLDTMLATGRQVVLNAGSPPEQLPKFMPQLVARLTEGLVVPLVFPAAAARAAILGRLADLRGMRLSQEAIACLAESLSVSVLQLMEAIEHLEPVAGQGNGPLDVGRIRLFLDRWQRARQPSIRQISLLVARHFGVKLSALRSASRSRVVTTPRSVAMYLARQLTDKSLKQIGQYFGGRDHTTVTHGCRRTEQRLASEPVIQEAVILLRNQANLAQASQKDVGLWKTC